MKIENEVGFTPMTMTWTAYIFMCLDFYAIDCNKNDKQSIEFNKHFKENLLKLTTMADEHNEMCEKIRKEEETKLKNK